MTRRPDIPALLLLAAFALAMYCHGARKGRVTVDDPYIRDVGSYLTNDVAHVAIEKKTPLLPDDTAILVYAREVAQSNATDWVRVTPHLTYADHPYDYQLPGLATNYNVLVAADFTPAPTVHTNGVWSISGFIIPNSGGKMGFKQTTTTLRKDPEE